MSSIFGCLFSPLPQPAVAKEGKGQAIETAEGEAGRREDALGCVQAVDFSNRP